jgi:hypothetical protein
MNNISPLERVRKVYKDKVDNFEKYSIGSSIREEQEQEEKIVEKLEEIEVSSSDLKNKRDKNSEPSKYVRKYSGEVSKILNDHQYRVQLSKRSMEIDNM